MSPEEPARIAISPDNPRMFRASWRGKTWDSTVDTEALGYLMIVYFPELVEISEPAKMLAGELMRPDAPQVGS